MNIKKYIIKNCFKDICEVSVDMDNVKYIFKQVISGDELLKVVDKQNNVYTYDSDMHTRIGSYIDGFDMIYPDNIDLDYGKYFEPDKTENFICIQKNKGE